MTETKHATTLRERLVFWVAEDADPPQGMIAYAGRDGLWTTDIHNAIKFISREDAQAWVTHHASSPANAVEHVIFGTAPDESQLARLVDALEGVSTGDACWCPPGLFHGRRPRDSEHTNQCCAARAALRLARMAS